MSTAAPGTMHDSAAWAQTQLEDILERGAIRISRRCIICDDAFAACGHLVPPWPDANVAISQDSVNYFGSQLRQAIERAFGF